MKKESKELASIENESIVLSMINDLVRDCGVVAGDILLIEDTTRNVSLSLDALFHHERTGVPMATTDKTINFKLHAKKLFQLYNLSFSEESRSDFLQKLSPDLKKWVAEPDQMNAVKALISDLLPNKNDAQSLEVVDYIISSKKKDVATLNLSGDQSVSDVVRAFVRENTDKWTAERGAGARLIHAPSPAKKARNNTLAASIEIKRFGRDAILLGVKNAEEWNAMKKELGATEKGAGLHPDEIRKYVAKVNA
jgi:hypothetical protein